MCVCVCEGGGPPPRTCARQIALDQMSVRGGPAGAALPAKTVPAYRFTAGGPTRLSPFFVERPTDGPGPAVCPSPGPCRPTPPGPRRPRSSLRAQCVASPGPCGPAGAPARPWRPLRASESRRGPATRKVHDMTALRVLRGRSGKPGLLAPPAAPSPARAWSPHPARTAPPPSPHPGPALGECRAASLWGLARPRTAAPSSPRPLPEPAWPGAVRFRPRGRRFLPSRTAPRVRRHAAPAARRAAATVGVTVRFGTAKAPAGNRGWRRPRLGKAGRRRPGAAPHGARLRVAATVNVRTQDPIEVLAGRIISMSILSEHRRTAPVRLRLAAATARQAFSAAARAGSGGSSVAVSAMTGTCLAALAGIPRRTGWLELPRVVRDCTQERYRS